MSNTDQPRPGDQLNSELARLDEVDSANAAVDQQQSSDIEALKAADVAHTATEQRQEAEIEELRAEIAALKASQSGGQTEQPPADGGGSDDDQPPAGDGDDQTEQPPADWAEQPTANDIVTDQDEITITVDINTPYDRRVQNVYGNGKTKVTALWDGNLDIRTSTDSKGGQVITDVHSTGNSVALYNCTTGLSINPPKNAGSGSTDSGQPGTPPPAASAPTYPATRDTPTTQVRPADIVVTVTDSSGKVFTYHGNDPSAINRGIRTYRGEKGSFSHEQIELSLPGYPLVVFFRPDTVGTPRWEVVVENGSKSIQDFALPADTLQYDIVVTVQGVEKFKRAGLTHYWGQRWRRSSADRPLLNTVAKLLRDKVVPPFRRLTPGQKLPGSVPAYDVLGFSSLVENQNQTGERFEIGLFHEFAAAYVATDDQQSLDATMAWAECAGSWSNTFRDKDTGAAPDFTTPYWSSRSYYWDQGSNQTLTPLNLFAMKGDPQGTPDGIAYAENHAPALSILAYLLTGDLYHLEEQQFSSNMAHATNHANVAGALDNFTSVSPSGYGEPRNAAWMMRDFAFGELTAAHEAAYATGTAALLPQAYFQKLLAAYLFAFNRDFVNAKPGDPYYQFGVFHGATSTFQFKWWMEDYLGLSATFLGYAPISARQDWAKFSAWKRRSNIDRTSGTSGFPRTSQGIYEVNTLKDAKGVLLLTWSALAAANGITDTPDGSINYGDSGISYACENLGCLGFGVVVGDQDAASPYNWLKGKMGDTANINWRDSIGPA